MSSNARKNKPSELQFVYEEEAIDETENTSDENPNETFDHLEFSATRILSEINFNNSSLDIQDIDDHSNKSISIKSEDSRPDLSRENINSPDTEMEMKDDIEEETEEAEEEAYDAEIEHSANPRHSNKNEISKKQNISGKLKLLKRSEEYERPRTKGIPKTSQEQHNSVINTAEMYEQIFEIKVQAEVKIAIAKFKSEFLAEQLGEAKALEFKVKQLLRPFAKSKNPEVLKQLKKISMLLEEHANGSINLVREKAKSDFTEKTCEEKSNKVKRQSLKNST